MPVMIRPYALKLAAILLFSWAFTSFALPFGSKKAAYRMHYRGGLQYAEGHYQRAASLFRRAYDIVPDNYYFALSLLCVAPFSVGDFAAIRWQDWLAMLYIGVSIYYTLGLYTRAYAIAPASAIAPITYLAIVLGGLWGWLIWGQIPDRWSLIGSALVIGGGLLTLFLGRARGARVEPG